MFGDSFVVRIPVIILFYEHTFRLTLRRLDGVSRNRSTSAPLQGRLAVEADNVGFQRRAKAVEMNRTTSSGKFMLIMCLMLHRVIPETNSICSAPVF